MKTEEILDNYENFKKRFITEKSKISFDDFERYFHVEEYFLSRNIPYLDRIFYSSALQITGNVLHHCIQDLNYYINIRPDNLLSSSDYEIVHDDKRIIKLYYEIHKLYKKFNYLYVIGKEETKESISFMEEAFEKIKEYFQINEELLIKMMNNIDKKISETDKKKEKKNFESSIFH